MTHFFKLKKAVGIGAPKFESNIKGYAAGGFVDANKESVDKRAKMTALEKLYKDLRSKK